jgi:mannitol/fructose-specific phosphotransferase system IIA component (Ntr-type)
MRTILREKGLRDEDPYEKVIGRAAVFDFNKKMRFEEVTDMVTQELSDRVNLSKEELSKRFLKNLEEGIITVSKTAALKHIRVDKDIETEIALVRCKEGFQIDKSYLEDIESFEENKIYCLIYLISSTKNSGQHLRILAHLAEMIDNTNFTERFLNAQDISDIREILLRDEHFINITLKQDSESKRIIGKQIKELEDFLPGKSLITMVKRNDELVFPHGDTVLKENDILSIIGEKGDIEELKSFL